MIPTPFDQLEFAGQPTSPSTALATLGEPFAGWFQETYGQPTLIQRHAWPVIPSRRNLLLCAPTGTGKTLAAFLPILKRLMGEDDANTRTSIRCLYVAPLKALINDAARNLSQSIEKIAALSGDDAPVPRLAVRHGDTMPAERRRILTQPPDILLTTPETLSLLLSLPAARNLFAHLNWVVVDEVHALAPTKRGADLALSLERLTDLCTTPLQRIALSATATPLVEVARYLVGVGRSCLIAAAAEVAPLRLKYSPLHGTGHFLAELVGRIEPELRSNCSTLIFTNTRSLAERLSWALRRLMPDWDEWIAVHHSALAAGRRREVEEAFKEGWLRAVVSSTSLELGIDIGKVDLVVLVHPPGDVVRLLQRVGRAGHGPGRIKCGLVFTATAAELLEVAVTGASGRSAQCEPLRIPDHPLDVLCQQLLGMAAAGSWTSEETFALVRRAYPYRHLTRRDFDDCIAYLLGICKDGEPWLSPRIRYERACYSIHDERTARLLRRNLGTILAEETASVVLHNTQANRRGITIGQLDRAYAERLQPGDRFLLDGRCLECKSLEGTLVVVDEVAGRPVTPRWGGDGWPLSSELAQRLYILRIQAAEALRDGPDSLSRMLRHDYGLEDRAVDALVCYFQRQDSLSEIPDATTVLIEAQLTELGANYYVHTPLNRLTNDALARVAVHRLVRDHGRAASSMVADLGFALQVRGVIGDVVGLLRLLLDPHDFEKDLGEALAESSVIRERFQRVALMGLMLLRIPIGRRRRVGGAEWAGSRLFDRVKARDPDFVLLRQAEREVLTDWCDARTAYQFALEMPGKQVRCRWLIGISPFVESWTQTGTGSVEEIESPEDMLQRLHEVLIGNGGNDAGPR